MYTSIQKWGNSGAVRLPKVILERLRLRENDRVEIVAVDDQIILRPVRLKNTSLEEIFAGWNGEMPEPYDWGELSAPVGSELI
ncbi:MAG: AbrB/MazE/SpoVT family DNA-binding domain-containing protein [Firmicutes bacterium]|nr:AbrB/MazE/SpoVT family DNA-binding domain-containing protein [Bacillota bacterium]